jgi:Zn-dependent peptidase ImmA (M78 family)/transcriptional regulator with XRE-family HTH domain
MKSGTPGFNGLRLKEAREARGMSAITLADLIGVTRGAVSQYESNRQSPRPEVMRLISQALNLPPHFFLRPSDTRSRTLFWRCMSAATKAARMRAARRYGWLRDIVAYIQRYIKFPKSAFADVSLPDDPARLTADEIDDAATALRTDWGLGNDGPVSNMVWLLESKGAVVTRCDLLAETLDAFSEWDEFDRANIILGADNRSAARSRFNAAHELGHMLLHKSIRRTAINQNDSFRLIEWQADRFAGAFLMPAAAFADDFYSPSLDALRAMKERWGVSIAAMINRAEELRLIDESQARSLWINLSRRKWKTTEPLDDSTPPELPTFLKRSVALLIEKRLMAPSELAIQLGLSQRDVESLIGLSEGYLDSAEPEVTVLDDAETHHADDSHIIPFPARRAAL